MGILTEPKYHEEQSSMPRKGAMIHMQNRIPRIDLVARTTLSLRESLCVAATILLVLIPCSEALAGQFDVGVIPDRYIGCPAGAEMIRITTDDEDDRNANNSWGWTGAILQDSHYTHFHFCRVDGTKLTQLAGSYAVLMLGEQCPSGSQPFFRYFDNEDRNNHNSYAGNIYPNESGWNTRMHFCLFPGLSGSSATFPDLSVPYGVFAAHDIPGIVGTGFVHTDDEDNSNENSFSYSYYGQHFIVERIISGGTNTDIRIVRVR
jgi:hypothetical protein